MPLVTFFGFCSSSSHAQKITSHFMLSLYISLLSSLKISTKKCFFNPNMPGGVKANPPPPVVFRKLYLLNRGWNPGFLWLLILSQNTCFLKISLNSLSRSEDMKKFPVSISYFRQFSSIFQIFWHYLLTKKLMTSLITDDVNIFSLSTYFK